MRLRSLRAGMLAGALVTTGLLAAPTASASSSVYAFGCTGGGDVARLEIDHGDGTTTSIGGVESGWVDPTSGGIHSIHVVGHDPWSQYRQLFRWQIPATIGDVAGVTLQVATENTCSEGTGSYPYAVWDITTTDLGSHQERAGRLWNDAGSGISYGEHALFLPTVDEWVSVPLNGAAAAAIGDAAGGRFAIGATLDDSFGLVEVTNDANGDDWIDVENDTDGDRRADDDDGCPTIADFGWADSDADGINDACDADQPAVVTVGSVVPSTEPCDPGVRVEWSGASDGLLSAAGWVTSFSTAATTTGDATIGFGIGESPFWGMLPFVLVGHRTAMASATDGVRTVELEQPVQVDGVRRPVLLADAGDHGSIAGCTRPSDGSTHRFDLPAGTAGTTDGFSTSSAHAEPGVLPNIAITVVPYGMADFDHDGLIADADWCPDITNADQVWGAECIADDGPVVVDADGDGVEDDRDTCVAVANADQTDTDGDGAGDACDADDDGDGVDDVDDSHPLDPGRDHDRNDDGIEDTAPPTNKDQCKGNGWRSFNNPSFRNQGDCVSFVQSRSGRK